MNMYTDAQTKACEYLADFYKSYVQNDKMSIGMYWSCVYLNEKYAMIIKHTGANFTEYKIIPASIYKRYVRYTKLWDQSRGKYDIHSKVWKSIQQKYIILLNKLKQDITDWVNVDLN